jgi:hypothetical protein
MAQAGDGRRLSGVISSRAPFKPLGRRFTLGQLAVAVSVTLLVLGAAACGGKSKTTTTTRTATSTTSSSTTTTTTTPASSVSTGPVHGRLTAANHAPVVGKDWHYALTVTDAAGHPLSGTADIEFVFSGVVVGRDTPPTHPVTDGRWHDTIRFPADAVGKPLTFRAVIHTSRGSITLDWPITVRQ